MEITRKENSIHERNDFNHRSSGTTAVGTGEDPFGQSLRAESASSGLAPTSIQRRAPRPQDVEIDILYCGVCHSDLHQVRDEWHAFMPTVYPCVPGHEMVGRVTRIGSAVKKFKEGDFAAVGCMVNA